MSRFDLSAGHFVHAVDPAVEEGCFGWIGELTAAVNEESTGSVVLS